MNNKNGNEIDLQSYGELEKFFYGGNSAVSFFRKEIDNLKTMPMAQQPVILKSISGTHSFNYTWCVEVPTDSYDFLTNVFLEVEIPEVKLKEDNLYGTNGRIRWTKNLLHNLIEECCLNFNSTCVSRIDNYSLDFLSEFLIKESKIENYKKNIGNIPEVVNPTQLLKKQTLFIPLNFLFFCRETANAIPLVLLPNTEIKIQFRFSPWENLLIYENMLSVESKIESPIIGRDIETAPIINHLQIIGNFVTVSSEEKRSISNKPHKLAIETIQTSPRQLVLQENIDLNLNFRNSIKQLMFAVVNSTYRNDKSNYTKNSKYSIIDNLSVPQKLDKKNSILKAGIFYNSEPRVPMLHENYFRYINPNNHCSRTPTTNICSYSFALNDNELSGGAPLSRIDHPTLKVEVDPSIINDGNRYELVTVAVSNSILTIDNGFGSIPVV